MGHIQVQYDSATGTDRWFLGFRDCLFRRRKRAHTRFVAVSARFQRTFGKFRAIETHRLKFVEPFDKFADVGAFCFTLALAARQRPAEPAVMPPVKKRKSCFTDGALFRVFIGHPAPRRQHSEGSGQPSIQEIHLPHGRTHTGLVWPRSDGRLFIS